MKNIFINLVITVVSLFFLNSCQEESKTFGDLNPPTNLTVTATIVGKDATHPVLRPWPAGRARPCRRHLGLCAGQAAGCAGGPVCAVALAVPGGAGAAATCARHRPA